MKTKTRTPLFPDDLVEKVHRLAQGVGPYRAVSLGFPGGIEHGIVRDPSNLARLSHLEVESEKEAAWLGFDLAAALRTHFSAALFIANDADVAALGCSDGRGNELTITLGTGVGCGRTRDGLLVEHQEIHEVVKKPRLRYDERLGTLALVACGEELWSQRVAELIEEVIAATHPDRIHLVGGNARRVNRRYLEAYLDVVWVHREAAGLLGGVVLATRS